MSGYRLLGMARRLGPPVAVMRRPAAPRVVAALGRHGATRVCVVEDMAAEPADGTAAGAARGAASTAVAVHALSELAWQMSAAAVLVPSDREGREIAARVAVRLGSGIITDAVDVFADPDGPVAVQEVCGGAYRVESVVRGATPVVTVACGTTAPAPAPPEAAVEPAVELMRVTLPEAERRVRVVARTRKPDRRPSVAAASVVVAGGRGVGSAEGFALVEKVADALGAAVGGTHAAADLGWCPQDALIGQTGAIVHPRLYIACGISGSVHHRAGIQHAATIVAIDRDPSAPIFQIADVGVVGDLHEVLPALLEELARRRNPAADEAI
ncbi:electron transfer flavoprotein subunit alpha/FixB family protein [Yinghuangia sp. YIM S09857]|uniref:electron transfer flavoprotein subunit alpha/FixB family protein n=1 Tax=Yinghuangia sp. YIM S09857 TaxID=3436929 RepID=UPI003F53DDF7